MGYCVDTLNGNVKGRDHFGDIAVSRRIILKCSGCEFVNFIHVVQDIVQWENFVNKATNFHTPQN
jgi:hypothetical protein